MNLKKLVTVLTLLTLSCYAVFSFTVDEIGEDYWNSMTIEQKKDFCLGVATEAYAWAETLRISTTNPTDELIMIRDRMMAAAEYTWQEMSQMIDNFYAEVDEYVPLWQAIHIAIYRRPSQSMREFNNQSRSGGAY